MDTSKILCVAGIFVCMVGTILSLWSILSARSGDVGTCAHFDSTQQRFRKERAKVAAGCGLIIVGSTLQIIGTIV